MIDLDSLDGINIINDQNSETRTVVSESLSTSSNNLGTAFSSMSQGDLHKNLLTCMLITANVGTIFEDPSLLELWFQQLRSYLIKVRPQLVAIHCQEVGGKNYESSMKNVSTFTDKIIGDQSTIDYNRVRIFLDENFESVEKFTALGSLYLIHKSVKNVKLFNFKTAQYESVEGVKVYAGNSINKAAEHVEKVKFPQELFPECRWSRKGFMRSRWLFNDVQPLDLVNIHLFHDASNLIAMEKTPSPYAKYRQQALQFTLEKLSEPLEGTTDESIKQQQQQHCQQEAEVISKVQNQTEKPMTNNVNDVEEVPLFIFGDFNFRLDTNKVIQKITDGVPPVVKRKANSNEVVEFIYHRRKDDLMDNITTTNKNCIDDNEKTKNVLIKNNDDDGNSNYIDGGGVVMTVGKKLFDCENLDETFRATENTEWLLELDNELDSFKSKLYEFKISFSPSYPFKEDTSGGYSYMKTRCPAWCDRILFNAAGCNMINSNKKLNNKDHKSITTDSEKRIELLQKHGDVSYRLMGNSVPMGDHKPVLLYCQLDLSSKNKINKRCSIEGNQQNNEITNSNSNSSGIVLESTTM